MLEPTKLKDLALDSIAKFTCRLCLKLTQLPASDERCKKTKDVCNEFHTQLVENVPTTLVDEVTCKLLTAVDEWWTFHKHDTENCPDILQEIVNCVIHPSVTRLGVKRDAVNCPQMLTSYKFINGNIMSLLQPVLPKLTRLKILDLHCEDMSFFFHPFIPKNLEGISLRTDDKLLKEIVTRCPDIKFLNITCSTTISDKSIPVILKLKSLEKLYIRGSSFSMQGMKKLFMKLSKNINLKELGTSFSTESKHLELISSHLPRVTLSLTGINIQSNLSDYDYLSGFENLRSLDVCESLDVLHKILPIVGPRLESLKIGVFIFGCTDDIVDFLLLGDYFENLTCLHFKFCVTINDFELQYFQIDRIPGWQSVKCLKVYGEIENSLEEAMQHVLKHILNQCFNVETVTIDWYDCFCQKEDFVERLFYDNQDILKKLEEIYFVKEQDCENDCDDGAVVDLLLSHCPCLKIMSGIKDRIGKKRRRCRKIKYFP